MRTATTSTTKRQPKKVVYDDRDYDRYLTRIQERFTNNVRGGTKPLFTTDATGLYDAYLAALPAANRQYHTCNACRRFIETYGALVTVMVNGRTRSALWDEKDAPEYYLPAVKAMLKLVSKAKVNGVFLSRDSTWGTPETGEWSHFSVKPSNKMLHAHCHLATASQAMAQKREDARSAGRALGEFSADIVDTALTILKSDALYRAEKVIGPAQFLADIHKAQAGLRGPARNNVLWLAVAKAPAGFCHPRSSMIGSLLEDLSAGMSVDTVSKRFAAKMHPLQYQRPTASPSAGNIAQAEKIVAQLGITDSLRRRYARLDEVQALWRREESSAKKTGGVFDHLKKEMPSVVDLPDVVMTWVKFQATVLDSIYSVEVHAPVNGNYAALVTACVADAKPILQWDLEGARNPVSWYLYMNGSPAHRWGLVAGWNKVTALCLQPSMWGTAALFCHQGKGVLALIEGAKDYGTPGLGLFPEILKSELHSVRSTIEAHSRKSAIEGRAEASACGLMTSGGGGLTLRVVTRDGVRRIYKIDRWD
jgi:hypothetical protein